MLFNLRLDEFSSDINPNPEYKSSEMKNGNIFSCYCLLFWGHSCIMNIHESHESWDVHLYASKIQPGVFAPPLSPQTFIHQTQIQCWCKWIFLRWWSSLTSSVLIGEREELMMHFYIKGAARPELKMCSLSPPQHDDGKFPQNISGTSL